MPHNKLIIPMVTPYSGRDIDNDAVEGMIEYASSNGFDGLFPAGSTGAFMALSFKDQEYILSKVIEKSPEKIHLFAGISRNNLNESTAMGKRAVDMGYKDVVIINPFYHKYSQDSIYNYFSLIAGKVDANIFLYNNPSLSGLSIEPETVRKLKDNYSSIKGMKDSSNDYAKFSEFLKIPGLEVYQGKDSKLEKSIEMGAVGGVCSTANFSLNTLHIARGHKKEGVDYQERAAKVVELVSKYESPTIHNLLFRKLVLGQESPVNYMKEPFVDLSEVPDLEEIIKYS